ncbi:vanadium-dependent haloperoxidase [Streptomyces sp. NPDC060223]|uniref:vanadium-dependent haloperoxidase n=1 Tax=unclassified Streptomyces TaxID=2593676 RepID=UPI0036371746
MTKDQPALARSPRTVRRTVLTGLTVLALGTTPLAATATTSAASNAVRTANPQVITDWNATAVATINGDAKRPSVEPFIWQGFASAAMYNAVVGIEGRYTPYKWHARGPRTASSEAAAAAAAHRVLSTYFPASQARLDAALTASLATIPDGRSEEQGVVFGKRAADHIIKLRENDGRGAAVPYGREPAPGVWRPTAPANAPFFGTWLARLRPLVLDAPDQFRPGPPPALTSRRYAADFAEVKLLGAKAGSSRTAEQTETALFFSDNLTVQFQGAFRDFATRHQLDIADSARLFAAGNTAAADAAVTAWDSKLEYAFWRPITAIQLADTDGNPATTADPSWLPLTDTPPYPDHISGHTTIDGAVMKVLSGLTGGRIDLRMSSAVTGTTRQYASADQYNRDVVDARVWEGIHFRTADVAGSKAGTRVGAWTLAHYFKPLH